MRLGILSLLLLFSFAFKKEESKKSMPNHNASKRTRIFIVDYVNSRWTGPIVKSFQQSLDKTKQNISYYHFIWTEKVDDKKFLNDLVEGQPDVIFLPDHIFYRKYAKELFTRTKAHISVHFCSAGRKDILPYHNQSGVFNEYPADKVIDFAKELFTIKKVAIIGGPYAADSVEKIKAPLAKSDLKIDSFMYSDWLSYKNKLLEIEKSYDAVWLLLPFGVKDGNYWVDFKKLEVLAKRLKIPSFGYGGVSSFPRTITVGSVQEKLGEACAKALYDSYFKGKSPEITNYTSYDVLINTEHFLHLGKKIPNHLTPFLR